MDFFEELFRVMDTAYDIRIGEVNLSGDLVFPSQASGLVIFSHGSGSSRFSPRNRMVANWFRKQGLASFLFDLLTPEEDRDYSSRFNIPLLTSRLIDVTRWLLEQPLVAQLPMGFFGASTGAASALRAAAALPQVKAVVSRGGRPDLATDALPLVQAPVLLIVGGNDPQVLELNEMALQQLPSVKQLEIVPGATHLFEEPGAMDTVCSLAANWFQRYLVSNGPHR